MNKNFTSKLIIFFTLFAIIFITGIFSYFYLDDKVNDFCTKIVTLIKKEKAPTNTVIISIDEVSTKEVKWPWTRDLFSDIFNFLEFEGNAKAIVFQNLISYPDTYNPEKDFIFYKNIRNNKKLIAGYFPVNSNIAGDILPSEYYEMFTQKKNLTITDKRTKKNNFLYKGILNLPKEYINSVKILGASILSEDKDEILRSYMPAIEFNNEIYPSTSLSAYALITGINEFELSDDFLCSTDNCKSLKIPIIHKKTKDYFDNTVNGIYSELSWYVPTAENYTHKTYSAIDIIKSYRALKNGEIPLISPGEFKDKNVIIGLHADKKIWEQMSETPILKRHADIDIQATALDNMLCSKFFQKKDVKSTIAITVIFSIFIILGFKKFKYNLFFASLLCLIYFVYYLAELNTGNIISPVTPIITIYSVTICKNIYIILTTDKTNEMLKRAMGKYVSKDVMKKVLTDLDKLKLGGTRSVVTILFVDIRNFTKIAEELPPQEVTSVLNEYFSVIEPIIGKYNGIINKYMGDGALVLFGEPIKNDFHALNSIKCGLEIIKKVQILKEKLLTEGKPKIDIGIGVNTGEVFAGNIGTEERFEYTVIGDNVNLAYRIEAYNQVLKTQFLISEYTYKYLKDKIDVVKLSEVNIKGKSKPIDIYEVLKLKNEQ